MDFSTVEKILKDRGYVVTIFETVAEDFLSYGGNQ